MLRMSNEILINDGVIFYDRNLKMNKIAFSLVAIPVLNYKEPVLLEQKCRAFGTLQYKKDLGICFNCITIDFDYKED